MSLTVSQIIAHVQNTHGDRWDASEIATTVSFICGFIVLGIGLLRLGWIIEFIPLPAVSGFMTGSGTLLLSLLRSKRSQGSSHQYCCGPGTRSDGNIRFRVCFLCVTHLYGMLMGAPSTRAATYHVIINTLKGLPRTNLNAAFGLPALVTLYAIRYLCEWLSRRYPRRGEPSHYTSSLQAISCPEQPVHCSLCPLQGMDLLSLF